MDHLRGDRSLSKGGPSSEEGCTLRRLPAGVLRVGGDSRVRGDELEPDMPGFHAELGLCIRGGSVCAKSGSTTL